jgi:membrane protease YdiL (CAAX protease family)
MGTPWVTNQERFSLIVALNTGFSRSKRIAIPGGRYVFTAVVLCLGLVGGAMMLKHNSILGAILFHAGYDLMALVSILKTG